MRHLNSRYNKICDELDKILSAKGLDPDITLYGDGQVDMYVTNENGERILVELDFHHADAYNSEGVKLRCNDPISAEYDFDEYYTGIFEDTIKELATDIINFCTDL